MSLNLTIVNSSTPSGMSDFQVISAIIALCALVLGIANAYFHWKDKQPNIKVDAYEFVDSAHSLTSDPERVITIRGGKMDRSRLRNHRTRICRPIYCSMKCQVARSSL